MNSEQIKESLGKFSEVVDFNYPAVGWYFSSEEIENSFIFKKSKWVCMFMYMKMVMNKGRRIRFSADYDSACDGPASYFGFTDIDENVSVFLTETERVYKSIDIAEAYIRETADRIHPPKDNYLYMEKIDNIDKDKKIEVVNIFPKGTANLLKLVTLSNYDRPGNDNAMTPASSACQGVFTIPYHEKYKDNPKSVIGLFDIVAMKLLPEDMLAFSMPSNRFVEMADNIDGSFLRKDVSNKT